MRSVVVGLFAMVCICMSVALADEASIKREAKTKAEELNEALLKEDYAKIARLTHPKVTELNGGEKKLIEAIEQGMKDMKSNGVSITSIDTQEPSKPVKQGKETYIVVPFTMKLKTPKGKLVSKSFVIGVTSDDAKTWTFVNGDVGDAPIKQILPNLPKELTLPKPQPPTVEN